MAQPNMADAAFAWASLKSHNINSEGCSRNGTVLKQNNVSGH